MESVRPKAPATGVVAGIGSVPYRDESCFSALDLTPDISER